MRHRDTPIRRLFADEAEMENRVGEQSQVGKVAAFAMKATWHVDRLLQVTQNFLLDFIPDDAALQAPMPMLFIMNM